MTLNLFYSPDCIYSLHVIKTFLVFSLLFKPSKEGKKIRQIHVWNIKTYYLSEIIDEIVWNKIQKVNLHVFLCLSFPYRTHFCREFLCIWKSRNQLIHWKLYEVLLVSKKRGLIKVFIYTLKYHKVPREEVSIVGIEDKDSTLLLNRNLVVDHLNQVHMHKEFC